MAPSNGIPHWGLIWAGCLRRIRRWRVPPNWGRADWLEEMESEGLLAALKARDEHDPARGMAFESFMHMRVVGHLVSRYRREWSFAHRLVGISLISAARDVVRPATEVEDALGRLTAQDSRILRGLFWEGCRETDLARELGISQQAICKRKRNALNRLRRKIGGEV